MSDTLTPGALSTFKSGDYDRGYDTDDALRIIIFLNLLSIISCLCYIFPVHQHVVISLRCV